MNLRIIKQGEPPPESPVYLALREAQQLHQFVRIERPEIENPYSHGIPVAVNPNLVLLCEIAVDQFRPDGYGIYRLDDIADIRSDEHERFYERLLAAEGIDPLPADLPDIDVTNWVTAMAAPHLHDQLISVEAELLPEPEYWVGILEQVDAESISLLCVSSTGEWDSDPIELEIGDVSCVQFGSRYLDVYARHCGLPR
jgi:hypothetical protein